MDFAKSVSFKSCGEKTTFFSALALSALRQLRIHADLLDGTAFEALSLVVCAMGQMYKKGVDTSLHPSNLAHAAPYFRL